MIILGLIDSKPSAAAIVADGTIIAAIAEERLNRMKFANGMPLQAISAVITEAGISPQDITRVAIGQKSLLYRPQPEPWDGWFDTSAETPLRKRFMDRIGSTMAPLAGHSRVARKSYRWVKDLVTQDRRWALPAMLRNRYQIQAPVDFLDHHFCHAASAYYVSNLEDALVITLDGGGDGRSGSVYTTERGRLKLLASVESIHSLGNFYSYITALCRFKAEHHEGKVTGLAAFGKPKYADVLRSFIGYEAPGQIRYRVPMYRESALRLIRSRLPEHFSRADLAASVQIVLEEIGTEFIRYWLQHTGRNNLAVAGGVFSNVKFNQRVHEIDGLKRLFVQPAMDDSGLAVGSALASHSTQPRNDPKTLLRSLPGMYLGPAYSDREVENAVRDAGVNAEYVPTITDVVARLLAQGFVVARFTGRMEYGPRALGNRSILYQTNDPTANQWLNEKLKRTEFMPFAPATLIEYARELYDGLAGVEDSARFMTITFDCSARMRHMSPGVVHVDGTARPQLVDPITAPDLYSILTSYYRLTGIPSLINTSFNLHGEPIVCTPQDALRSFYLGKLDYLAIENWLVSRPMPLRGQRQAAFAHTDASSGL